MENTKDIKLQLEDLKNVISGQKSNPVYIEVNSILKEYINKDKLDPKQIVETLSKYKFDYFINETIKEISTKYKITEKTAPISGNVTEAIFEFKIVNEIKTIRTSQVAKNPMVSGYLIQLEQYINANKGVPQYRYINEFITRLTPYKYDTDIKTIVEKLEVFIKENSSKLLILDTVYNLRKQNVNGFYDGVLEKLENSIFKNDYSYSGLQLETREYKTIPVIKSLVESVAKLEGKEFKVWETSTNKVKVQNVICPVKSEKDKTVLFLEGKFLLVAGKKVTQLSEEKVIEKLPKFYSYCKNFETIGFSNTNEGLNKQISNYVTIDLKTNESGDLKPFINGTEVKTTKNLNEVMVTEGYETRNKLASLLEGIDKVGLLEEVKLINNTSEGSKIYIFKLEEAYNLFVIEKNQIKLFESTGFQTYQYVNKKFKFDISTIFENEIKTAHNTLKKLEEKKGEIIKSLSIVENSMKKIDESIKINSNDSAKVNKLEALKSDLEKEVINLKEAYTTLDIESKEISSLKEEATNYTYEMGETVKLKDGTIGEIVSINDATNEYGIYTKDNQFVVAKEEDIETSVSGEAEPEVQMQGDDVTPGEDQQDKSVENADLELDQIEGENPDGTPDIEDEETIDDVLDPNDETQILQENVNEDKQQRIDFIMNLHEDGNFYDTHKPLFDKLYNTLKENGIDPTVIDDVSVALAELPEDILNSISREWGYGLEENANTDNTMEADQTETSAEPIVATVTEDYGDFKIGDKLQIDPASYTSSGDEDLVAIIKKVEAEDQTPIENVITDTEPVQLQDEPTPMVGAPVTPNVDAEKELDTTNPISITIPKKFLSLEILLGQQ